jgi:hypothetical protein
MSPEFFGISDRPQESLVEFLRVGLALGFTFLGTAKIDILDDPVHSKSAVENARAVLNTLRHFAERISDTAIREEIESEVNRLEGDIGRF